uniref:Uncharacterized protein n=1 Tax=Aegilops tauschii subsp. strangulata TaxID=200361 RepID=A0A453NVH0_AEGTS
MKIAIGIAQGLRYLHTELQPPFAISELNSNSAYVIEILPKLQHARWCGNADQRSQPTQGHGQRADAGFIVRLRQVSKAIHLSSFSSDPFY